MQYYSYKKIKRMISQDLPIINYVTSGDICDNKLAMHNINSTCAFFVGGVS